MRMNIQESSRCAGEDKIKVLHVMRPALGGMREHVFSLLRQIDIDQYEPMVACPKKIPIDRKILLRGVEIKYIELKANFAPYCDLKAFLQLYSCIRSNRVQIVHTHGAKAGLVGRAAAVLAGAPVVISTVHNFIYQSRVPGWQKFLHKTAERILGPFTDHYIAVSDALARDFARENGISTEKISTIYNGINLEKFNMVLDCSRKKKNLGLEPFAPVVGTVGRLIKSKGVSYFIEAAAYIKEDFPHAQFLVVGDGPEKKQLQQYAWELGVYPNIRFTGFRQDLLSIFPLINIFVVPSVSEGQSIVTIEAMASRRPVVAFEVGGIPEVVMHDKTGILVPVIDSSRLAAAVKRLLENPAWSERLGNNARDFVEEKFDKKSMIRETEKLYEQCLKEKGVVLEPQLQA